MAPSEISPAASVNSTSSKPARWTAVGTADHDELHDIAEAAEQRLARPVSIHRVSAESWNNPDPSDTFMESVQQRPHVELKLFDGEEGEFDEVEPGP